MQTVIRKATLERVRESRGERAVAALLSHFAPDAAGDVRVETTDPTFLGWQDEHPMLERTPTVAEIVAAGAVGLAQAAVAEVTGAGLSPKEVVDERRRLCHACPHVRWLSAVRLRVAQCGLCQCFIEPKIAIASRACPDTPKRWEAV